MVWPLMTPLEPCRAISGFYHGIHQKHERSGLCFQVFQLFPPVTFYAVVHEALPCGHQLHYECSVRSDLGLANAGGL